MRDNGDSQERKKGGLGVFILFILILFLLAGAAGAFYGSRIQEKPKDLSDTSVKSFNLMEESKTAHKTVDDALLLKRENWQLRDTERRQHHDQLESSGADVLWTDREVAVGVPVTTELEGASRWVQEHLRNTDVVFINEEESEWNGMDAWRLNLGIAVKSGKDTERKFITDTVFFFHHGNMTNRDRDIPKIPKEVKPSEEKKDKTKNSNGEMSGSKS